jgi:hypothetical protein
MLVARIYNRLIRPAILTAKPNKSFEFIIESAASFSPMMQDLLCGDLRPNSVRDCGVETKKHSVIICDNCLLSGKTDRSCNAGRQSFVCMLRENSFDAAIGHEPHECDGDIYHGGDARPPECGDNPSRIQRW